MLVVFEGKVGGEDIGDAVFVGGVVVDAEWRHETLERHEGHAAEGAFFQDRKRAKIIVGIGAATDGDAVVVDGVLHLPGLAAGDYCEQDAGYDDDNGIEPVASDQKNTTGNSRPDGNEYQVPAGFFVVRDKFRGGPSDTFAAVLHAEVSGLRLVEITIFRHGRSGFGLGAKEMLLVIGVRSCRCNCSLRMVRLRGR